MGGPAAVLVVQRNKVAAQYRIGHRTENNEFKPAFTSRFCGIVAEYSIKQYIN
jgi:hypothetical protein